MIEVLTAQDVFGFLRPDQVHAISEASQRVSYVAGHTVYTEGATAKHFFTILDGTVELYLRGKAGERILIDQLTRGAMFGSCICFYRDSYALTALCTRDCELLRVENAVLKDLMDKDLVMGYALQTRISQVYFNRYVHTMRQLRECIGPASSREDQYLTSP
jgi:CRP-like cAMP-binding protein